jgi:hypothetical protein
MLGAALSLCVVAAASLQADGSQAKVEAPTLTVQASGLTRGPYGERWEFNIAADGAVDLKVGYMLSGAGSLQGQFGPAKHRVEAVRAAVLKERFMDLPSDLSPEMVALHMPDLRLSISFGEQTHKVRIYSPDQMGKDPRARRFLAVWRAVFQHVPIRPSW